ncbi:MAG: response regulator containing a CheY-like receiver domain and an DNA-binding domain [Herbinix sp.]|jgi:DNA-binding CsgD family transcriptional regulator|nr:response regulator containing a CheY-like receiver domain and an DNA-binding domain [Herbinix sp.]
MNKLQHMLLHRINKSGMPSISMRLRLFLFLLVLVLTMISGIIVILLVSGIFTAGLSESSQIIKSELEHSSQEISNQFGQLSLQAVEFSEELSKQFEDTLNHMNLTIDKLSTNPDKLEELISEVYDLTYYSLEKADCSGAFIILNTTVNPALSNAEFSRAGLYLKNMEPNIISSSAPNMTVLRGFPSIGRENTIGLHAQWSMEFDITEADYYTIPQKEALHNRRLSMSRLYYWSDPLILPDTSEEVMLCSVPILDSSHNLYGVCGFEVSAMLFKLSHMPYNHTFSRMFCMLSPLQEDMVDINRSLFAGSYSVKDLVEEVTSLKVVPDGKSFTTYGIENKNIYLGYHSTIQLYPNDSPYADETWVSAVLVPKDDIVNSITRVNLILASLLTLLFTLGIIISIVFSNKYLKPISEGIEIIKSTAPGNAPKTNVQEIDDLINFLSIYKNELNRKVEEDKYQLTVLEQFAEKTKILSPAERSVFNLYVQGLNAKEIADRMFLSINTIKTHNKRIYSKLNVASREELLLYINMLKEIGRDLS